MSEKKPPSRLREATRPEKPGQVQDIDADSILKMEDTSELASEGVGNGGASPIASAGSKSGSSASGSKPQQGKTLKPLSADADLLGGESSGGFETMLGTLVVESGLVSPDEMELCNSMLRESAASEEPRTLADLLLENEMLTQRQLQRMRSEFEAKRSSQRIPGYRILSKLGSGAMATVFLADQISLDRPVAIKVLPKKFSDNVKFIERFYKEGRAAAKLNHPNIVAAYDVGQAGEHHFFVMEYIDGLTVYDRLVKDKRMDEQLAIRTTMQVAKALQHAHARGFIHRDIKPKNIMFNSQGVVKLADLGLARAMSDKEAAKAEAGRAYGTPYYISPEQIRGEIKIGPQADIYGLGATFYHMVTGRVPFEGKNPSAVMHQHLKTELTPPDHLNPKVSPGTALVIETMMAKDPAERYQNASDLLQDLELIARNQPPHFARNKFDLTEVATSIASDAIQTAKVVQHKPVNTGPRLSESPAFLIAMVILGLSVLGNILMILMLAG